MAMGTGQRLESLENALKELAYAGRRTEMSIDRLSEELRGHSRRAELAREDAERAHEDAERVRVRDRAEAKEEHRRMNRKWGELANKWGTFTEDVVLPNFPRILVRYFGLSEDDLEQVMPRVRVRRARGDVKEFDLVAWSADTVFWNETKSRGTQSEFEPFLADDTIFRYFPHLENRALVRIASALYFNREVLSFLTLHGVYAMMLGDETMDLVNFRDITGREPPEDPAI